MNTVRRLAAVTRNLAYAEQEILRIEELRRTGEPTVAAFPGQVDDYLRDLRNKIERYKIEMIQLGDPASRVWSENDGST